MGEANEEVRRGEILFLYEVKMANPNGDPADENKPRIDEETGKNIVTDVRLKRTIRDYIDSKYQGDDGKGVFVKAYFNDDGRLKSRKEILDDLRNKLKEKGINDITPEKLAEMFIDVRLFGLTFAGKGDSKGENVKTLTGPVQFRFGISLNEVEPKLVSGTTVLPSKEGKSAGTFTSYWIVPYSLIGFYGVVNENVAKETGLTNEDLKILREGMWEGTAWLSTRSKHQFPRLLLHVEHEDPSEMIGDLADFVEFVPKNEAIRSVNDYCLEVGKLIDKIASSSAKCIHVKVSDELCLLENGKEISVEEFEKRLKKLVQTNESNKD